MAVSSKTPCFIAQHHGALIRTVLPPESHAKVLIPSTLYIIPIHLLFSCYKLCLTLCDPMDWSPPGSSDHGIFQAGIPEWVAISYSRGSSWRPRGRIHVSCVSCIGRWILYPYATWEALLWRWLYWIWHWKNTAFVRVCFLMYKMRSINWSLRSFSALAILNFSRCINSLSLIVSWKLHNLWGSPLLNLHFKCI